MATVEISGRTVAVTGAASGIGAALALEAAARGAAAVAVIDIDVDGAQRTAHKIRESGCASAAFQCDVSKADELERVAAAVVEELGIPGLVCANAGVGTSNARLLDAELEDLQWALSVNVIGTWATIKAFGQHLRHSAESGWFLVTASEHAVGVPFIGNGFYTLSKHAVLGLADVLRRELPQNLGVSVVIPGLAATEFWKSGAQRPADFGGPLPIAESAARIMARGMDPETVAARALDGVVADRFLIATHHHVRRYADERAADLAAAFDELGPADGPSLDLPTVIAALKSGRSGRTL